MYLQGQTLSGRCLYRGSCKNVWRDLGYDRSSAFGDQIGADQTA